MANIRTARRSGFITRGGRNVRETLWIGVGGTATNLSAASTAAFINSGSAGLLALRPFTMVRTRGYLHCRSDQNAANESFGVSLGYAVVSDQASAIGVTAVPVPDTDIDSDLWFVYQTLLGFTQFATAAGFRDYGIGVEYDSKAMRKMEDGQDLAVVIQTPSIVLGTTVQHIGRVLIKLH